MRHVLVAAALLAGFALTASCRDPTEIVVRISTDAKCGDIHGVALATGTLGDALDGKPASTVSMACDPATGHLGTVVLLPSGADDTEVDFRVTAGFGQSVEACKAPFGPGCIVARRALRYIPNTPLYVPVTLSVSCNGVPCGATSTCQNGACVDPHVDPTQCTDPSGCDVADGGTPPVDAGPDTGVPDAGAPVIAPIIQVGNVPYETGTSMQQHILHTDNGGYYWFFYYDSSNVNALQRARSADLVTWTPEGEVVTGDTGSEGRNFSAAYADIAGHDVVHIVASHQSGQTYGAYHDRLETKKGLVVSSPPETSVITTTTSSFPAGGMPDGPAVALSSDAKVFLATGWMNENGITQSFDTYANMDVYQSSAPDTGVAGPQGTSTSDYHHWVLTYVNNRALVPLDAGRVLAVWPQADVHPDSSDLSWAWSGDGWVDDPNRLVFGAGSPTAQNDWAVCAVTPTSVHAVRREVGGGTNEVYDDMIFDAAKGAWTPGAAIPKQAGQYGTGVVLLTDGARMLLFSVASDGNDSIVYTRYDGTQWSAWQTLVGSAAKRVALSGSGCAAKDHQVLLWTEGYVAPYTAMAAGVAGLF